MRSSLLAALAAALLAACGAGDKNDNVEPVCVAGAMQCSDALAAVETCKADGSGWEVTQECLAGAVCQDRKCRCPGTKVPSAGGCVQVGVTECPDGFVLEENGCAVKPGACGAGEIISIGKCTKVGIQQCAEGWDADADTGGCVVAEKGCGEGKEWSIGTGCLGFGPKLSCGDLASPWTAVPEGATDVVYVSAKSTADGEDGTAALPFKKLSTALAAAPAGAVVLLAATGGPTTYQAGVTIDKPVRILGKCAEYVTLTGGTEFVPPHSDYPAAYALRIKGASGVELAGFTVADENPKPGAGNSGILAEGADGLSVHDVILNDRFGAALDVRNSEGVSVRDCTLARTVQFEQLSPYGQTAYAINLDGSKDAEISGCRLEETQGIDLMAAQSCPTVVRNRFSKRGPSGGLSPMGIWVKGCDGTVVVDGNRFLDKMTHAVLVQGGDALLRRNLVSGTVTDYEDLNGPALRVDGGTFVIEENHLVGNQYAGIGVKGGHGEVRRNRVEDTLPSDPGLKAGFGIMVNDCDPGPVTLSENTVKGSVRCGILVSRSIAVVADNVILATNPPPSGTTGVGAAVNIVEGAAATLTGNLMTDNFGVTVRFDSSSGVVQGNAIANTGGLDKGQCGAGLMGMQSVFAEDVADNLITGNACAGIYLEDSDLPRIARNIIEKTTRTESGALGVGVVLDGTDGAVEENWIRANDDTGVLVRGGTGGCRGNVIEGNGLKGKGGGLVVQAVTAVPYEVEGNTFVGNGLAGTVFRNSDYVARGNSFFDGEPNLEGLAGVGAWVEEGGEGELRTNLFAGNRLAGVLAFQAQQVAVSGNYAGHTGKGSVPTEDEPVQMGDGIAATGQSFLTAIHNKCEANLFSGLFFTDAEGVASENELVDNGWYGLELSQSEITMETNLFSGNVEGPSDEDSVRTGPVLALGDWEPCTPGIGR